MAPTKHMCVKCDKIIKANSSSLSCFNCKKWYHKKCSGLSNEVFDKLALDFKKSGINSWVCSSCKLEVSIVESEDEECYDDEDSEVPSKKIIMECMETLLCKHLDPFKKELKSIREDMKTMEKDIRSLKEANSDVKKLGNKNDKGLVELGKRLDQLEKINPSVNEVLRESKDRKRREDSIIGFNIPESKKDTGIDRQLEDKDRFKQLVSEDCEINFDKIKVNRIGKMVGDKARPLKIVLQSKEQARQVLKVKPKDGTVWFKPDLTRMHLRDKLREVRKELNSRQEAGESNLVIKYNFGEPYVDEKKENFRRVQPKIMIN